MSSYNNWVNNKVPAPPVTINPRGRRMLTEGQGQIFRYARVARNYVGPLAGFAVPAGVLAGWFIFPALTDGVRADLGLPPAPKPI